LPSRQNLGDWRTLVTSIGKSTYRKREKARYNKLVQDDGSLCRDNDDGPSRKTKYQATAGRSADRAGIQARAVLIVPFGKALPLRRLPYRSVRQIQMIRSTTLTDAFDLLVDFLIFGLDLRVPFHRRALRDRSVDTPAAYAASP
jgi:hypothetical protein